MHDVLIASAARKVLERSGVSLDDVQVIELKGGGQGIALLLGRE
jgi:hypothetical protein